MTCGPVLWSRTPCPLDLFLNMVFSSHNTPFSRANENDERAAYTLFSTPALSRAAVWRRSRLSFNSWLFVCIVPEAARRMRVTRRIVLRARPRGRWRNKLPFRHAYHQFHFLWLRHRRTKAWPFAHQRFLLGNALPVARIGKYLPRLARSIAQRAHQRLCLRLSELFRSTLRSRRRQRTGARGRPRCGHTLARDNAWHWRQWSRQLAGDKHALHCVAAFSGKIFAGIKLASPQAFCDLAHRKPLVYDTFNRQAIRLRGPQREVTNQPVVQKREAAVTPLASLGQRS